MPGAPEPAGIVTRAAMAEIERLAGEGFCVVGICGAQGSGKSTLARNLLGICERQGIAAAALSLDDLYLPRGARLAMARQIHPLFATRGVPGTHDVALGLEVVEALAGGEPVLLPRFSKAADDRLPRSKWSRAPRGCRVLLFEGWCVGARPQAPEALLRPVNALERFEDPEGVWRRHVNAALGGEYQNLFAAIGSLILLAAPAFEVVFDWRRQQEDELRGALAQAGPGVMDVRQIARFVQHYERLTRHILVEMPQRAELVINLAPDRSPLSVCSARR